MHPVQVERLHEHSCTPHSSLTKCIPVLYLITYVECIDNTLTGVFLLSVTDTQTNNDSKCYNCSNYYKKQQSQ